MTSFVEAVMCYSLIVWIYYVYLKGRSPIWKKLGFGLIRAAMWTFFDNSECLWCPFWRLSVRNSCQGHAFTDFGAHLSPKGPPRWKWVAKSAARVSIWTSIGVGFWSHLLPGVISRRVLGSPKKRCNSKPLVHRYWATFWRAWPPFTMVIPDVIACRPFFWKARFGFVFGWRNGYILESYWQAILREIQTRGAPEKLSFWEKAKVLVRGL